MAGRLIRRLEYQAHTIARQRAAVDVGEFEGAYEQLAGRGGHAHPYHHRFSSGPGDDRSTHITEDMPTNPASDLGHGPGLFFGAAVRGNAPAQVVVEVDEPLVLRCPPVEVDSVLCEDHSVLFGKSPAPVGVVSKLNNVEQEGLHSSCL